MLYVYVCVYIYMYIYFYLCVFIYIYVCVCIPFLPIFFEHLLDKLFANFLHLQFFVTDFMCSSHT